MHFFFAIYRDNNSTGHPHDANEMDETEHKKVGVIFVVENSDNLRIFFFVWFLQPHKIFNNIKIALLVLVWILFTGILMQKEEKVLSYKQLSIPVNITKSEFLKIC